LHKQFPEMAKKKVKTKEILNIIKSGFSREHTISQGEETFNFSI